MLPVLRLPKPLRHSTHQGGKCDLITPLLKSSLPLPSTFSIKSPVFGVSSCTPLPLTLPSSFKNTPSLYLPVTWSQLWCPETCPTASGPYAFISVICPLTWYPTVASLPGKCLCFPLNSWASITPPGSLPIPARIKYILTPLWYFCPL